MEIIKHDLKFKNKLTTRKTTKRIVLHCTATNEGQSYSVERIHSQHLNQGWSGIAYHYVIYADGSVHQGRPETAVGSHCQGYNSDSIGIVYVGGLRNGKAADTRTVEQKKSQCMLVSELMQKYDIALPQVQMHRDLCGGKKACPCHTKSTWDSDYIEWTKVAHKL